jgi:hypothetical protein
MKNESQLQNYLRLQAIKNGMTFDKVESRSRKGFPDCLIVFQGVVTFIEVKSPSGAGKLSGLQQRVLTDLHEHGARVWVVDSGTGVKTVIEAIKLQAIIQREFNNAEA